jgi:hypothetical protein
MAKVSQSQSGRWGSGLIFLEGFASPQTWQTGLLRDGAIVLVVFGLLLSLFNYKKWPAVSNPVFHIVLGWTVLYILVYGLVIKPPGYLWYYTPVSIALSLVATLYFESFYRLLTDCTKISQPILTGLFSAFLIIAAIQLPIQYYQRSISGKYEVYGLAAEFLNEKAEEGDSVGANEIGILRYFYNKGPVIDGLGLTLPEMSQRVKIGDYSWYVQKYHPDFLMFNYPHRPVLESMVDEKWFQDKYSMIEIIETKRLAVAIYQRNP